MTPSIGRWWVFSFHYSFFQFFQSLVSSFISLMVHPILISIPALYWSSVCLSLSVPCSSCFMYFFWSAYYLPFSKSVSTNLVDYFSQFVVLLFQFSTYYLISNSLIFCYSFEVVHSYCWPCRPTSVVSFMFYLRIKLPVWLWFYTSVIWYFFLFRPFSLQFCS